MKPLSQHTIRYGQCWEDADVVLEALNVKPGDTVLSICSAGDNSLAILAKNPAKVIAIDLSAAQLACLELRVAAYRCLEYQEVLSLMGCDDKHDRRDLYKKCLPHLSPSTQTFWNARKSTIDAGLFSSGKFESYFSTFRNVVLPLVHSAENISNLIAGGDTQKRNLFYANVWNTWQWRALFKIFFSRFIMGLLGREASFFQYAQGDIYDFLMGSTKHALTVLDPASNPYLQWILIGKFKTSLPFALRPENFQIIKANLDRLEWRQDSLEQVLEKCGEQTFDSFNLSDVFEYMSEETYVDSLKKLCVAGKPNARLVYWNMMADRRRPETMSTNLRPQMELASRLYAENKTFFYTRLVVEEVTNG